MYYSQSTNCFYILAIHGNNMPGDAVEITKAEHAALFEKISQSLGGETSAGADGYPIMVLPLAPTLDDLKAEKRAEINTARLVANRANFVHAGKAIACDELSRSDIDGINGYVAVYGAMPVDWLGAWKAVDNSYLPVPDVDAWKDFYASMVAQGNANFARAQALKAALEVATTAEQVAAIVW